MVRKQTAPPQPFNQMSFISKYEVIGTDRLRQEVMKHKRELDKITRTPYEQKQQDKFFAERFKIAHSKVVLLEQMLKKSIEIDRSVKSFWAQRIPTLKREVQQLKKQSGPSETDVAKRISDQALREIERRVEDKYRQKFDELKRELNRK